MFSLRFTCLCLSLVLKHTLSLLLLLHISLCISVHFSSVFIILSPVFFVSPCVQGMVARFLPHSSVGFLLAFMTHLMELYGEYYMGPSSSCEFFVAFHCVFRDGVCCTFFAVLLVPFPAFLVPFLSYFSSRIFSRLVSEFVVRLVDAAF